MAERLETPETLQEAVEFFADEDRCIAYFAQMRWPDGIVTCPICNQPNPRYLANQRRFECRKRHPKRQFSVKVGTIFEDSPIPLKSWLLAVWQITNCKNGISSYELARALGVTQKTAWFMNHRIRLAMQGEDGGLLDGEVEVDETYIGGKTRKMNTGRRKVMLQDGTHKRNEWAGKVAVMGLLERHPAKGKSRVRTKPLDTIRKHRMISEVTKNVEDGSTVYTDALASYGRLPAPALSEFLVVVHPAGPDYIQTINKSARFDIKPFDTMAAIEAAEMFKKFVADGNKRGGAEGDWQKINVDRQIVAMAKVNGAACLYAADNAVLAIATRWRVPCIPVWQLPLPPVDSQQNMLDQLQT